MTNLSGNQKSFINLMTKSTEHARRGFELLTQRPDLDKFFDALAAEGLFNPDHNPAPVPVDPPGSVRIPYWPALSYLLACAKISDRRPEGTLAVSVMNVIRSVSSFREKDGSIRDNYHTFRCFAEILGVVPTAIVTVEDMDLVPIWLSSRFDHSTIVVALDEGPLKRFLASDCSEDWAKATRLLGHCLAVRWHVEERRGINEEEPVPVVDPYWLERLIGHHASDLGRKSRGDAAAVLRDVVREVFSRGGRASWSYLVRPAVEDHSQNQSWRTADNAIVEGLRDVLLGWCDVDPVGVMPFVNDMLHADVEMLRRIGIYILDKRWNLFCELYSEVVPKLYDAGHMHELYKLLASHFEEFDDDQKTVTIEAIRNIPVPEGEDGDDRLKRIQHRWLSAVSGTTYEPAAAWLAELAADPHVAIPDHPEFITYIETSLGPGPTPYQVQELVAFAEQRLIVERLNAFQPQDSWRGPSTEALVETLEEAVMAAPASFMRVLPLFIDAASRYKHGLVRGFKRLWDTPRDQQPPADWDEIWRRLMGFFEELFQNPEAGRTTDGGDESAHNGLVSAIADLLRAGSRDDDHAYPQVLLPRGWALLEILANRAEAVQRAEEGDPMTRAINSPKGRTIEALFGHALRECRLSDKESRSHADAWARMRPLFDRELEKCENGNYEFSTLAGAYIANLDYISSDWLRSKLPQLFPADRPATFGCALGGLAYSAPTRRTYVMLRDARVIDAALRLQLKDRAPREKLIEQVVLGYLWNEEAIDSPRLSYLFDSNLIDDLEIASWFLWRVRGERLSTEQVAKIIAFWDRCIAWAQSQPNPPAKLLSSLATLAWSLRDAEGRNRELLLAVAPHVTIGHTSHEFLKELVRLVEVSPDEISEVLGKLIETYEPAYDYEGVVKTLVARLAELGQRPAALAYCGRLRSVNGMRELFEELRGP